jgi:DGQHR domain-containing protein
MQYRFTSAEDRNACMDYCNQTLAARRAQLTIEYMTTLVQLQPNSPSNDLREFWDSFLQLIASTYRNKSVDDLKPDYPWGCWQLNMQSAIDDAPTIWGGKVSRHDKGAYQIHTYYRPLSPNVPSSSGAPGFSEGDDNKITWELMVAKQQGRDVLVGAVNVGEIDATCMVPHLPNFAATNEGSMLLARWSLNSKRGLSQWQRRPDPIRIKAISNFMDSSDDNLIINSIMLYIPKEANGVSIEKEGNIARVTIDPAQFLAPSGDHLTDVTIKEKNGNITYDDHRPIWIVDGQHRTRGMALSKRGFSLDVPVVVTHGGGDDVIELEEVAKVFTEINTLAKPLDSFQQHYLSHKFSIVSSDKDRTYGPPELGLDEKDRKNRLANIRMYKLASMLTKDKGGPFENGVQLIDGMGAAIKTRIRINEFFKQMKPLFMTGIYSDPELTMEEIHDDFSDYLSAWENTANHHSWQHMPNKLRWKPNRGNSSELEGSQAIVWIIFKTFEFIKRVAKKRGLEFSEASYTEILAPVRGIDWYSKELEKRFEQQYRPASEFMSIWIKQAIMNETVRSKSEVASINIEDVHHGMALYAKPSNPVITFNKGALSTSITLTWEHGNVYKQPSECYILKNNQKIDIDNVEWDFSVPDGTEEGPSTATYTINVDNFEDEDWEIIVNTRTIKPTGEVIITPDTLK